MSKSEINSNQKESESTMTVAELKAILDTLPDDTEIFVNHERTRLRHPELFYSPYSEMIDAPELNIVPSGTAAQIDAQERAGWRQVNKPRPGFQEPTRDC